MILKIVVILLFLLIFASLGSALVYLLRGKHDKQVAKALTIRIGLSLLVFVILLIGFAMGWIQPNY